MIRLRPYKPLDSKYISKWITNEEDFAKWCANLIDYPPNYENMLKVYNQFENTEEGWFFTALDETGTPVGFFMITKVNYEKNTAHIGFVIVDKLRRSNGYGKEMVRQAINYAFNTLYLSSVTLKVFDNNERAHKCYESVGFTDESYDRNSFEYNDKTWGCYLMSIHKGEIL